MFVHLVGRVSLVTASTQPPHLVCSHRFTSPFASPSPRNSQHPETPLSQPTAMFGRFFHLGVDAILIAAFLAGIRRSTGLT
jgi:hypothetical protein